MPTVRPYNRVPLYAPKCEEQRRLVEEASGKVPWKKWGTYVAERCWGTVREDYSANGDAWNYLPHDHARSAAYRWCEDGLAGWCDEDQYLCLAAAFWNGRDSILKERAFGLSGDEGNHGEDVKEYYYYLDNTPTHSYAKYLYKYPQCAFPYEDLVRVNAQRKAEAASFEYELLDTGAFDEDRYFDIFIEYAKATPETTVMRVTAHNRGPDAAPLWFLPTLWFRDIWTWDRKATRPEMKLANGPAAQILASHSQLGERRLILDAGHTDVLFTENATNARRLYGKPNASVYCKDAFHEFLVNKRADAVNPTQLGTKAAAVYQDEISAGEKHEWTIVLSDGELGADFSAERVLQIRKEECDAFYTEIHPPEATAEEKSVQRQALSGLLWNKQYYHIDVRKWIRGDEREVTGPTPHRKATRNERWTDLNADFVMSMPDKWEYPWFASWDLALQCVSIALVDPDFAKEQLLLLTSEAMLHHNGQLPAYEWEFSDANPPVQAWAALKVYQSGRRHFGIRDRDFLERIFQKLLLTFGWWVNRKDADQNNIFEGGFLGLDNISVFDRSEQLEGGGHLEQSDGSAWMGLFALNMMRIAFQLALEDPVYEDLATKFFEHFMVLANAINRSETEGGECLGLWDDRDGFYYDRLRHPDGNTQALRVRSLVGLLPLVASEILFQEDLERLPMFKQRYEWFITHRPDLASSILTSVGSGGRRRHLLSIVGEKRFRRILQRLLNENEFLSPYGLRSLSKVHAEQPFVIHMNGGSRCVAYEPAESISKLKGGNSNWRGPIWFPTCCLLLDTLTIFDKFIGDAIKFPFPAPDGEAKSPGEIAAEIGNRLINLFLRDPKTGRRPCYGGVDKLQNDPHWREHLLFFEYFHGDNGAGLGAMHQTGWTAFVANVIDRKYRVTKS